MGWLGLDDTDHLDGGCTTHTLFRLLQDLPKEFEFFNPRLVRLWPFAKTRTRGNAAVCVEIRTRNVDALIDFLDQWWEDNIQQLKGMVTQFENHQRLQYPTDPGMVWFNGPVDEDFYWQAVSREVSIEDAPMADFSWGGLGKIGATAAISWPARDTTFEAIAWRIDSNITQGKTRRVDLSKLAIIDKDENTFMSRDLRTNNVLISPRGNCPVLFGLRTKTIDSASSNCEFLINSAMTEKICGYMIFETNQATDDHLANDKTALVEGKTVLGRGTVVITTDSGQVLMAFAESGNVKLLAQWLVEGDKIGYNGLVNFDQAIHLERLKIITAKTVKQRPKCEKCNVRMKSMGKNQPLRCSKCRKVSNKLWEEIPRQPPYEDWVQPPMDSRRHLSKPMSWNR